MEKLAQPLEGVQRKRLDEGNMHKNRFHVKVPSMSVVQKGIVQQSASGPAEACGTPCQVVSSHPSSAEGYLRLAEFAMEAQFLQGHSAF